MSFRRKIKHFLVHACGYSNAIAGEMIRKGRVALNENTVVDNVILYETDSVTVDGVLKRKGFTYGYIRFHKPKGYVSSLSPRVKYSLFDYFQDLEGYSIAGRLDKDSEGLLILSNDGKWVNEIISPASQKEKEYEVEVDKPLEKEVLERLREGVQIGMQLTKPCLAETLSDTRLKIVLTEGKYRQIRRMLHKQGYRVLSLRRTRIENFYLSDLKPGERWLI